MKTNAHCPGPWTCEPVAERATQKTHGAFRVFNEGEDGFPIQRTEANGRLIAAAPALLAAVEAMLPLQDWTVGQASRDALALARAALAAARA